MIGKVPVGGRVIDAIIIDTGCIEACEYRRSLIDVLKAAVTHPDKVIEYEDVWNVLDIIQATLPEKGGGS